MSKPSYFTITPSPIGDLLLMSNGRELTGLYALPHKNAPAAEAMERRDELFAGVTDQLDRYWRGELREFSVPVAPEGTPFQQRVWAALMDIPFGKTESYGRLAARIGAPGAARAVGGANSRNPISIVIPCHRVIGSTGVLTGYAGGLSRKEQLLALESGVPLDPAEARR